MQVNITIPLPIVEPVSSDTNTLPGGYRGVPYSASIDIQGGYAPLVATCDNLPPGLTISPDGTISGTSNVNWNADIDVHLTDAQGA